MLGLGRGHRHRSRAVRVRRTHGYIWRSCCSWNSTNPTSGPKRGCRTRRPAICRRSCVFGLAVILVALHVVDLGTRVDPNDRVSGAHDGIEPPDCAMAGAIVQRNAATAKAWNERMLWTPEKTENCELGPGTNVPDVDDNARERPDVRTTARKGALPAGTQSAGDACFDGGGGSAGAAAIELARGGVDVRLRGKIVVAARQDLRRRDLAALRARNGRPRRGALPTVSVSPRASWSRRAGQ